MRRIFSVLLFVFILLGLCACADDVAETIATKGIDSFSVGYAKADISPDGSVPLGGMGDEGSRFSNQVMDKLYATCVAFADPDGNKVLLFGTDLLCSYGTVVEKVRQRISEETGVPFSHVMFFASHTHSATAQNLQAISTVVDANQKFSDNCIQAAKDALADLKPAQMYGTFARPEGLNFVRHYIISDGTYRGKAVGELPASQVYGHMWKADNLLQLVKFVREGGKDVVLINWQAHYYGATKENYNGISADYPGVLRSELESALDCHAAFVLGGAGNISSYSLIRGETKADNYVEHGKMLAEEALKVTDRFEQLETGPIIFKEQNFVMDGALKVNPVYALGFGDFGMTFAPFEIFDIHARSVRESSNYKYTFYASCANDKNGYLPHEEAFSYYAYEVKNDGYPQGTAEKLQEVLTGLINECFDESGQAVKGHPDGYVTEPFEPYSDDVVYTNPYVGDTSKIVQSTNDHYPLMLIAGTSGGKNLVIDNRELAEKIVARDSMKLLFDDRNIVVGIVE